MIIQKLNAFSLEVSHGFGPLVAQQPHTLPIPPAIHPRFCEAHPAKMRVASSGTSGSPRSRANRGSSAFVSTAGLQDREMESWGDALWRGPPLKWSKALWMSSLL